MVRGGGPGPAHQPQSCTRTSCQAGTWRGRGPWASQTDAAHLALTWPRRCGLSLGGSLERIHATGKSKSTVPARCNHVRRHKVRMRGRPPPACSLKTATGSTPPRGPTLGKKVPPQASPLLPLQPLGPGDHLSSPPKSQVCVPSALKAA